MHRLYQIIWLILLCGCVPSVGLAQNLPVGLSLPPSLNFATSPAPLGSGARAAGKGFAFIAVADDATAASHNPAGLVQLERPELSIVGSSFIRLEEPDVNRPETIIGDQTLNRLSLNYLSLAYPFRVWQRNVVVSLNFQRLFDLTGDADVTSRFTAIEGIQRVQSQQDGGLFTISPAVAVQMTPTFAAGMAFNIWPDVFGNGWDQDVKVRSEGRVASGNRIVPFTSTGRINEAFEFQGFNVTAGFLWSINRLFTLGGVFRSPFTAKLTRKHASTLTVDLQDGSAPVTSALNFTETLDMDMPMSYGLGLSARLSDQLTLALDVARVHWSEFKLEDSTQDDVLLVENGATAGKGQAVLGGKSDDTTSVRLGGEYLWIQPKLVIPVRAGVFYDPEPGEGGIDDFWGFSLGTGVAFKQFIGDIAYTFRTGTIDTEATDTSVIQHKILLSVIYHF